MSIPFKRWQLHEPAPPDLIRKIPHIPPLAVQILYNRGLRDPHSIEVFWENRFDFDNPYRLKDLPDAVQRIRLAIRRRECIAIYGDFDVDGVTSSVVLSKVLDALGARYISYIPHRIDEGYGLNKQAIKLLHDKGCSLLVTVDCGIRSVEEVAYARHLGMDVVLTDHHSIGAGLPPANAVVNPKREDDRYPFKDLAGVGVSYKLAQGLLRAERNVPLHRGKAGLGEEDLLDLVALGTVADIVPLLGENRYLVTKGLERLNDPRRPGLVAMMEEAGVKLGQVTAMTIGFVLGPRLNAAGRLDTARLSYELLYTERMERAVELAAQLGALNRQRQEKTRRSTDKAREQIIEGDPDAPILLVSSPEFHRGIVGLIASRLAEEFYRPALVARREETFTYGSARSIPAFHITHALDRVKHLLHRYGGHAAAAGFTVRTDRLDDLKNALLSVAEEEYTEEEWTPKVQIDAPLPFPAINLDLYQEVAKMEPFGEGNPKPVFCAGNVRVQSARPVGKDGSHLKLFLEQQGVRVGAIAFRRGDLAGQIPSVVDVAFNLSLNEWNGKRTLELLVLDIQPVGSGCAGV